MSFTVTVDPAHGGRWTSLRDAGGREWLWSRDEPRRNSAAVGDAFADAGGFEECVPTVAGNPDHGAVWTRQWKPLGDGLAVQTQEFELRRSIDASGASIVADYELFATPGYRFLWAGHALLDLAIGARIEAPDKHPVRIWPGHVRVRHTTWPVPLGIPFAELGPNDGSATFAALVDLPHVTVHDAGGSLQLNLEVDGQPQSVGLWRNLGGYPWDGTAPYRNIGVEPMLGRVLDLATAEESDTAVVPASGVVHWRLTIGQL